MEISQPIMTLTPTTWYHTDETMAVKYHLINSALFRMPMDNSVIVLPLFNYLETYYLASQLHTPKTHVAFLQDVHCKFRKLTASVYPHKLYPMYGY